MKHSMATSDKKVLTFTNTVTFALTLTYFLLLPCSHHVSASSAWDKRDEYIKNSNMTEEEKFQARLLLNHRRYCRTSRTCTTGVAPDSCEYCSPCQCDEKCFHYGDCCPDLLIKGVEKVPPLELKQGCKDNLYAGYNATQREARLANSTGYFMTSTCPEGSPAQLQQACTNASLFLPVSVTFSSRETTDQAEDAAPDDKDVAVFANEFCALCHGFDVSNVTAWKLMVMCPDIKQHSQENGIADLVQRATEDDSCYVMYSPPPDLPPRQCFFSDHVIGTCNETGKWPSRDDFVQRACGAYLDPFSAEGREFKNVFCYLCNTDPKDPAVHDEHLFGTCWNHGGLNPMPFSALVDPMDVMLGLRNSRPVQKCLPNQLYDGKRDECRPVLCSMGRTYQREECLSILGSAQGLGYMLYFGLTSDKELVLDGPGDLLHALPELLDDRLLEMMNYTARWTDFAVMFDTSSKTGRCSMLSRSLYLYATLKVIEPVPQDLMENTLLTLRNTTIFINQSRINGSDDHVVLNSHVDERTWMNVHNPSTSALKTGKNTKTGTCATSISVFQNAEVGDRNVPYTRVDDLLLRPQVTLHQGEFKVVMATQMLRVPWLEEDIPLERYNTGSDGTVRILLEDFMPKLDAYKKALRPVDETEQLLSLVCTSLSLSGLALTFVTYAVFKPLRTAPGKNNMNLCLALFVAQLIYLVGSGRTEIPGVCQAMGILIHYSWLAAFAAMSVCSFHMWRVFTSLTVAHDHHDDDQTKRRLLQYTVYIWGASAAVVVVTLLTHLIVTGGHSIGYGDHYCYLSTTFGIIFAMGVPVALTVLINAVFFALTVRTIRASPKISKSRQDEHHMWVYLKLSTLTGVTWTLAFFVIFTEVKALEYVFTVVNALQGIFICASFVFNRRVVALYSACFRGDSSSLLPSSGTVHTSSSSKSTETSFTDSTKTKI